MEYKDKNGIELKEGDKITYEFNRCYLY